MSTPLLAASTLDAPLGCPIDQHAAHSETRKLPLDEESCAVLAKDRLDQPRGDAGTVDPAEITRFAALAEEWWNPNGKFKAIHDFNPVRLDFIIEQSVQR